MKAPRGLFHPVQHPHPAASVPSSTTDLHEFTVLSLGDSSGLRMLTAALSVVRLTRYSVERIPPPRRTEQLQRGDPMIWNMIRIAPKFFSVLLDVTRNQQGKFRRNP